MNSFTNSSSTYLAASTGPVLAPFSGFICDICKEEYSPERPPLYTPCDHYLCADCCYIIVEKTFPGQASECPFCSDLFTADSVRLVSPDTPPSGLSVPRRFPVTNPDLIALSKSEFEVLNQRKAGHLISGSHEERQIEVIRSMEDKVERIATQERYSIEEITELYFELEKWFPAKKDNRTSALFLSAALLRAIVTKHLVPRPAREAILEDKTYELEERISNMEADARRNLNSIRHKLLYAQKTQECQRLHADVYALTCASGKNGVPGTSLTPAPNTRPSAFSRNSWQHISVPTSGTSTADVDAGAGASSLHIRHMQPVSTGTLWRPTGVAFSETSDRPAADSEIVTADSDSDLTSGISVYSHPSSRTTSTDYGVYYRRRAISDISEEDDVEQWENDNGWPW